MYILKGMLLAFLAFQFLSCENEPLTGEFPQETPSSAGVGQFIARIAGEEFVASSVSADLMENQKLTITGSDASGRTINLVVKVLEDSNYSLGDVETGTAWATYKDSIQNSFSYGTSQELNAVGTLNFSDIDRENKKLTGTFNFKGSRLKMGEDGMPETDSNGFPMMEDIEITNGAFNSINYTLDGEDNGGGDDDGDGEDREDEFFAKVNGEDFNAETLAITESVISNNRMIKIEARTADHQLIRIDVPKSLGVGTFEMETLSDGTKLIGVYKTSGSENLTSHNGTMTITEFDLIGGVLAATFKFDAKDPLGREDTVVRVRQGNMKIHFEGVPGAYDRMSARIDDAAFTPETVQVETTVVNRYPRMILTGRYGDQKLMISFPQTITEGTFDIGAVVDAGNEIVGELTPVVGTSITYTSSQGQFVVTSYDYENGIIEGTFEFTAVDPSGQDETEYEVTAGEFLVLVP